MFGRRKEKELLLCSGKRTRGMEEEKNQRQQQEVDKADIFVIYFLNNSGRWSKRT